MAESTRKSSIPGSSVTIVGAIVNAFLILIKFAAGVFGQSQALIMDAVHSVSDLFTDVVVLVGLKMGKKPPDTDPPLAMGVLRHCRLLQLGLRWLLQPSI